MIARVVVGVFSLFVVTMVTGAPAIAAPNIIADIQISKEKPVDPAGDPVAVSPPAMPTETEVGLVLLKVTDIDPPSAHFPSMDIEAFLEVRWIDPRLAFDPAKVGIQEEMFLGVDAQFELERIWHPDLIGAERNS